MKNNLIHTYARARADPSIHIFVQSSHFRVSRNAVNSIVGEEREEVNKSETE